MNKKRSNADVARVGFGWSIFLLIGLIVVMLLPNVAIWLGIEGLTPIQGFSIAIAFFGFMAAIYILHKRRD